MNRNFILDKEYLSIDFSENQFVFGDYEKCSFSNCLMNNLDLTNINFEECVFEGCDLSLVLVRNTTFQKVKFINCKLIGVQFDLCYNFLLALGFQECILNFASFYQLKIQETSFKGSILTEVDFTETNLSKSNFDNCDLSGAIFERTILEEADFRTAQNFVINPETNNIKKASFSLHSLAGLLSKYNIIIE